MSFLNKCFQKTLNGNLKKGPMNEIVSNANTKHWKFKFLINMITEFNLRSRVSDGYPPVSYLFKSQQSIVKVNLLKISLFNLSTVMFFVHKIARSKK